MKDYSNWLIGVLITIAIALNLVVLVRYANNAEALQSSTSHAIQTQDAYDASKRRVSELTIEKSSIDSSLREERIKTESLEQENESLKVNLQAKQEQEAQVASIPQSVAPVAVSGSCEDWLAQAGISDKVNARILIQRESGCNPYADNPTSDAYGIPQALPGNKMASHGADWATNPVTQLRWMEDYVLSRYGSWANAVGHSSAMGWY